MAKEQDYFMTLDPATKRVPRERLIDAYDYAEQIQESLSREVTWEEHGPNNVGGRTRAIMFDPNDPTYKQVWAGGVASHISVSPFSENTLFIGTGSGRLFKVENTKNESPSYSEIGSNNFPNGYISCVELGQNEGQILVTFSNYGVSSVWESLNGGSTWEEKENNLPDMPVRWAVYNPTNFNEVLLATEVGVWSSLNFNSSSPNWVPSNSGLANVRTDMIQIRSSDNFVIAATHGRGLFSSSGFQHIAEASLNTIILTSNVSQGTHGQESLQLSNVGEEGSVLSYAITTNYSSSRNRDQQFISYFDETLFEGGVFGAIDLPYESGTGVSFTQYGTRFTPTAPIDILEGVWIYFGNYLDPTNNTVPEILINIYGDNGNNFPGELIGQTTVDMDSYISMGWNFIDLSSMNISLDVDEDFFVTAKV